MSVRTPLICFFFAAARPSFDSYPATEVFKGTPAPPILRTSHQRMFRTMIRDAAKKGPNFAGHYMIASWGCGAGCVSLALIDEKTGTVYDGPFGTIAWTPSQGESEPLSFRTNSRLLIARGCPEEDEKACGSYFYEWTGSTFKLLRKVVAVPAAPQ